ncbi:2-thiouracil desulfurase family protein [Desulfuromonas thiophila]|uniref:DUF523 domain-containing protein n=1 Tax=Desulfuromonas thiophila TaxID=57664 RepID=UPI0029F588F2|nr:2-thiouracil desulfurase family protein [Desulfuromonas thiophila]
MTAPRPLLVSACLLGLTTRYDGASKGSLSVQALLQQLALIPVPICPEQLGGLATPRLPCCFTAGDGEALLRGEARLCDSGGIDRSAAFVHGAHQALEIARLTGCRCALLKERSPSCGSHQVYLGQECSAGRGVTAALLAQQGVALFSEDELPALRQHLLASSSQNTESRQKFLATSGESC